MPNIYEAIKYFKVSDGTEIEYAVHTSLIMASAGDMFKQLFAFLADNA